MEKFKKILYWIKLALWLIESVFGMEGDKPVKPSDSENVKKKTET